MSNGRRFTSNRDDRDFGASTSSALEIFERWWAAYQAQQETWISRDAAQRIFFAGWDAGYDASSQIWKTLATRKGERSGQAAHGEAAPDAEAVDA